jgi:hypothetical protein
MEEQKMALSLNTKITALALTAALLGGSIGAIVEHNSSSKANQESAKTATSLDQNSTGQVAEDNSLSNGATADNSQLVSTSAVDQSTAKTVEYQPARARTVASAQPVRSSSTSRSVYRSHATSRPVSGWEKHRDILTVAMGAGGGALLGGLIGGRKGTAIGALAGAGGSALYTYKLRKKNRN